MPIQEKVLIDCLEPFKGFVLSTMIFAMHKHGLDEDFQRGITLPDLLLSRGGLDRARVTALVDYLAAAGVIARDPTGLLTLTPLGHRFGQARPWYEMMIGGYGITFLELGDHLAQGSPAAPRVGRFVASGSCGISKHDSIPLVRKLLATAGRDYRFLLDLGCGSGVYLTELCGDYPEMRAVGIEPDATAVQAAREWVAEQPTADRVRVVQSGALEWLGSAAELPDLAILAFVAHEVLGQEGEEGVRRLLTGLFEVAPDLDLIIIEVDLQSSGEAAMKHPLAQNYYHAYYLMHPFTQQRLETRQWWEALFADCGLEIAASSLTDPAMDSTGLEVGWLLRRSA
jgi:2-ketoarginine methyltransferase